MSEMSIFKTTKIGDNPAITARTNVEGRPVFFQWRRKYFNLSGTLTALLDFTGVVRDSRWFIFKPKIPLWANFGGP
jgi:hypothetical protein